MSAATRVLRELFEAGVEIADDVTEAVMRRFGDAPDTPANVRAVRQAVQHPARPRAADFVVPARVRRQPAQEIREVPQSLEARKRERPRVEALTVETTPNRVVAPEVSIYDYEGRPFITSMSDLSAAGDEITAVNDVPLSMAVQRQGGQDYMFDNPDAVWAADRGNAAAHMGLAARLRDETGQDPIFMPWAMGAKAIDFSHMPRELMLQYAAAQRGRRGRNALSRDIRDIMPDFRDVDDPASLAVFQGATGRQRGALNRLLDQMRDEGGMGIGSARLAMSDTEQLGAPLTSLRNVGLIDTRGALGLSTHPSYNTAVPGTGLGRLRENIGVLEVLPELARGLNDPFAFPVGVVPGRPSPLRSLQMKPRGGILTEDILRAIESRQAALRDDVGYADGGRVDAGAVDALDAGAVEPANLPFGVTSLVKNDDGSVSTVRTISVGVDGGEALIPTVYDNRAHSNAEAIERYQRTGKHFGVYPNIAAADAAAQRLHESHAQKLAVRP